MKTIHEILIIIKEEYLKEINDPKSSGLCRTSTKAFKQGLITLKEQHLFIEYLSANAPKHVVKKGHNSFSFSEDYCVEYVTADYFWKVGYSLPRKQWLTRNINLTK